MIIGKTRTNQPVEKEQGFDTAVEGLIQADKDIVSQIVYDVENGKIIFPKNVKPLLVCDNEGSEYYFDYTNGKLLSDAGYQLMDSIEYIEGHVVINDANYDFIEGGEVIYPLEVVEYILFDGSNGAGFDLLNTYELYNIPEGGTKLYKHTIATTATIDGNQYSGTMEIINNVSSPYDYGSFEDALIISGKLHLTYTYLGFYAFAIGEQNRNVATLVYKVSGGSITGIEEGKIYTWIFAGTDTVTPL